MKSMIVASTNANPAAPATNYTSPCGAINFSTTESFVQMVMPCDCIMTRLHVGVGVAPGSGKSHVCTVRQNNADPVNGLTCTITGTSQTAAKDDVNSISFQKGDKFSIKVVTSSGIANATGFCMTMIIDTGDGAGGGYPVFFGNGSTAITTTQFFAPGGGQVAGTGSEALVYAPLAVVGASTKFKDLFVLSDAAMTGIMSWTFTVRCSGDTTLTCVLDASNPTTNSDQTHQPTVTAGGATSLHVVAANTPSSSRIVGGFVVVPTTDGDASWFSSYANITGATGTIYYAFLNGSRTSYATTEPLGVPQQILDTCRVKGMYCILSSAPGAGKTYTDTLRIGGVNSSLNVALANVTTGNTTGAAIDIAVDDRVDNQINPGAGVTNLSRHQIGTSYTIPSTVYLPRMGFINFQDPGIV